MTDLIEVVPPSVSLTVPIVVDGDVLAVSLANSNNTYEQLSALIQDIDSEVGDWDFTKQVAKHFATVLLEFATESDDGDLLEALQRLLAVFPKD